jgi:hypothetical protein
MTLYWRREEDSAPSVSLRLTPGRPLAGLSLGRTASLFLASLGVRLSWPAEEEKDCGRPASDPRFTKSPRHFRPDCPCSLIVGVVECYANPVSCLIPRLSRWFGLFC